MLHSFGSILVDSTPPCQQLHPTRSSSRRHEQQYCLVKSPNSVTKTPSPRHCRALHVPQSLKHQNISWAIELRGSRLPDAGRCPFDSALALRHTPLSNRKTPRLSHGQALTQSEGRGGVRESSRPGHLDRDGGRRSERANLILYRPIWGKTTTERGDNGCWTGSVMHAAAMSFL